MITYEFVSLTCIGLGALALILLCVMINQLMKMTDQLDLIYIRLIDYTVKLDRVSFRLMEHEEKSENKNGAV